MTRHIPDPSRAVRVAWALALTAGCTLAIAQTQPTAPLRPSVPEVEHVNGVAYVTGGVSYAGRQQTIELGSPMNLQLVFTRMPDGIYLADVDVTITDPAGREVLEVESSDPLLFARLRPGTYHITAAVDGKTIERKVKVPAGGQHTEFFHWHGTRTARASR